MKIDRHAGSARERPRPRHRRGAVHRRPARAVPEPAARLAGVRAARARAASASSTRRAALDEPGVVTVLTQADVPGEGDTGANRHDEPLFPTEVMFHRQPVAWVLGETLEAAQRGAARVTVEYEPLPAILTIEAGHRGRQLSDRSRCASSTATSSPSTRARCASTASSAIGGQEHFYLETQARLAWIDESGLHRGALVDAASVGDAGGRRARARRAAQSGDGRVPAHGRRVRRQGSAGQSVGGDRRARRVEDEASRARAADARARHGAHRQAASLPCALRRRVLAGRPSEAAAPRALLRRRLEPRSLRADHVALALPLRQRLPAAGRRGDRPRLPHAQDLADRVSRLRRAAGDARDRRHPVAGRAARWICPPTSSASATSIATATRPTTASRCATPAASSRSGAR